MAGIRRITPQAAQVPLRYRIDPTAKKLDDLDKLESELERANVKGMPSELYHELLDKLQADRAGIIKRRDKGKPEEEKDYESMPFSACPSRFDLITCNVISWFNTHNAFRLLVFIVLCMMFRK